VVYNGKSLFSGLILLSSSVSVSGSREGSPGEDSPEKVSQEWFTMGNPYSPGLYFSPAPSPSPSLAPSPAPAPASPAPAPALAPAPSSKHFTQRLPQWCPMETSHVTTLTAKSILTTKSPHTTRNHPNTTTKKLPFWHQTGHLHTTSTDKSTANLRTKIRTD